MLNITRINHSAINTRCELDEMNHFYAEVLGAKRVKRDIPEKFDKLIPGFWMEFSNGLVHVIEYDDEGEKPQVLPSKHSNPMGPHLAFYVENIEAAAEHLDSHHILYDRFESFIFTRDPAGNTVEFQQDPECG